MGLATTSSPEQIRKLNPVHMRNDDCETLLEHLLAGAYDDNPQIKTALRDKLNDVSQHCFRVSHHIIASVLAFARGCV
jgi:hypothetical protein